jgi:hypothetical protein
MEYSHLFLSNEESCERDTISSLQPQLDSTERLFNFYFSLYYRQSDDSETDYSSLDLALLVIHTRIISGFNCLFGLLKRGHYCECQSIQRDIFELIYLCEYLTKNPEKVDPWWHGEEIKHRHVANNLELPESVRKMYGSMCDFTHPNIKGARSTLVLQPSLEQIYFKYIPEFHKPTAHALLIQQITFMFTSTRQFFQHFEKFNHFTSEDKVIFDNFYDEWQKERILWENLVSEGDYEMFPILYKQ